MSLCVRKDCYMDAAQTKRLICDIFERVLRTRIETGSSGGCTPQPEVPAPPNPTQLGALCRLSARIQYLLDLLDCEANSPDPETQALCCAQAYADYRAVVAACPP